MAEGTKGSGVKRFFKNLLIWFLGFLFGIFALIGGVVATLKFVSIDSVVSLFGGDATDVVSEDVAKKSLFDAVFSLSSFTVGDVTPVKDLILSLKEDETVSLFINIDEDKLNATSITNVGNIFGDSVTMKDKSEIRLQDVISESGNENVYKIIRDAVNKPTEEIYVGDLESFAIDNIKLNSILEESENTDLYKTIRDSIGKPTGDIMISDLDAFEMNNVKMQSFLPEESNGDMYKIIRDAIGKPTGDIMVSDLSSFDVNLVELSKFLDPTTHDRTFAIIRSGIKRQDNSTVPSDYNVLLGDLNDFDIDNVKLNDVLSPADCADNKFLTAILQKDDVTLGNMSAKINELKMSEVFPDIQCFIKDTDLAENPDLAVSGCGRYNLNSDGVYTYDENGEYYIRKDAGAWLFLFYSFDSLDAKGNATSYVDAGLTVSKLQNGVYNVTDKIHNASLRQLVDTGILENKSYTPDSYHSKLADLIPVV